MYRVPTFIVGSLDWIIFSQKTAYWIPVLRSGYNFANSYRGPQLSIYGAVSQRYLWYWLQLQKEKPLDCEKKQKKHGVLNRSSVLEVLALQV
jgi:hypothetical protein